VRITEGSAIDEQSRISMAIEITERKHKSVSVGVKYLTDEGPGAKISWENRNLFHHGEKLSTYLELSNYTTASETGFRKLGFLNDDQSLRLSLRVANYHPEAYKSKSIISSGFIDRDLTKILRAGVGLTVKSSKIDQLGSVEYYNLLSLPLYFEMDKRDDLLDPVIGDRLSLQLTPYYQTSGASNTFGKVLVSYKRYIRISRKPLISVAANLTVSVIRGAAREDIPADERLYAGGGGSIRGYAYQSVGPLSNGVPVGGKSLFESSMELRLKLSERFGLVAFIDGGNAYIEDIFSSGEPLLWGTGLGLRYYTPVGPFRLDVGMPLNRRKGIDDSYQIYLSLGQAF
jgi:translocation and assembly module TamA